MQQIEERRYETVLKRSPYVKQILKIGLAFSGKNVVSVHQIKDLKINTDGDKIVSQFEKKEKILAVTKIAHLAGKSSSKAEITAYGYKL